MGTLRIAIVGTPRSGNMWLRRLLVHSCDAIEVSADTPAGVAWEELPPSAVLQLHWPPEEHLLELLDRHRFAPVVLARHPIDVLVSILQFAQHESRTARWLNGAWGNELPLVGADPTSPRFREYALSRRATSLLGVTPAWWESSSLAGRVAYEDLSASPAAQIEKLLDQLGVRPARPAADAVARTTLETMRTETGNGHVWMGKPGSWRNLVTHGLAREIAVTHDVSFSRLGYDWDADPALDEELVRQTWSSLSRQPRRPRSAVQLVDRVEAHRAVHHADPAGLVSELYRLVLRRPPDEHGERRATAALAAGLLSPATLLAELVATPEARAIRAADDATAFAGWARVNGERPREVESRPETTESALATMWALSRYRAEPAVLDIGTAHADPAYVAAVGALGARRLVGVDPAPFALPAIETLTADVRSLPLRSRSWDVAFCLGTLHHVGCDNRPYGLGAEHDPDGPRAALVELRRVLRPAGRLLVSVPTGAARHYGVFEQRPPRAWLELFSTCGFFVFEHELYERRPDGWAATTGSVAELEYGARGSGASALLCAELRPKRLRDAARRRAARLATRLR